MPNLAFRDIVTWLDSDRNCQIGVVDKIPPYNGVYKDEVEVYPLISGFRKNLSINSLFPIKTGSLVIRKADLKSDQKIRFLKITKIAYSNNYHEITLYTEYNAFSVSEIIPIEIAILQSQHIKAQYAEYLNKFTENKESNMSTVSMTKSDKPGNFLAITKNEVTHNAKSAVVRTSTRKLVQAVKKPLVAVLMARADKETANKVGAFLNTREGEALLAGVLGLAQLIIPRLNTPTFTTLGEELRTSSLTFLTDLAADSLVDPLIDAFSEASKDLTNLVAESL